MGESEPPVAVRGLVKEYRRWFGLRRRLAVDGVSFTAPPASVTAIVGPNGGGKSTTMKCLLGLLRPTRGDVRLFGRPPSDLAARARLGYLPEESPFPPFLRLEAALRFYAELGKVPRAERGARAGELLERVGLAWARGARVGELSKGMLRRFGLAQALVARPEVLVLDEPTSGLDPFGVRDFRAIVEAERARGTAVLLSSHLLADVEKVADRVVLFHRGKILADGALAEVTDGAGGLEAAFFRAVERADGAGGGAPGAKT